MKLVLAITMLLATTLSGADEAKKGVKVPHRLTTALSMDAHEVQGVDRGKLSLLPESEPVSNSRLTPLDADDVNWAAKVLQSQEDLCRW